MDTGKCLRDGFCDVYRQTDDASVHRRASDTDWCACTEEMCISECSNFFVCGEHRVPKIFLVTREAICINCDVMFGAKLEMKRTEVKSECTVCMEEADEWVKWPGCVHEFCIECTKTLHYGPKKPLIEEEGYQRMFEKRTECCPLCRFEHVAGWRHF
jgi:hypothetical protein